MSAVIKFPKIIKLDPKRFHRQRLFWIGKVLEGTSYSCIYQEYYLRRNEVIRGNKRWSLKIFGFRKKTDKDPKFYAVSSCDAEELPDMLDKWNLGNKISYKRLYRMGWRGKITKTAKIYHFINSNKKEGQYPPFFLYQCVFGAGIKPTTEGLLG